MYIVYNSQIIGTLDSEASGHACSGGYSISVECQRHWKSKLSSCALGHLLSIIPLNSFYLWGGIGACFSLLAEHSQRLTGRKSVEIQHRQLKGRTVGCYFEGIAEARAESSKAELLGDPRSSAPCPRTSHRC